MRRVLQPYRHRTAVYKVLGIPNRSFEGQDVGALGRVGEDRRPPFGGSDAGEHADRTEAAMRARDLADLRAQLGRQRGEVPGVGEPGIPSEDLAVELTIMGSG